MMSTSKGSSIRNRPQKHQNRTVFKNDLHDTSKKTKTLNSLQISGVCSRCKDILEWKIKYKKYKPLTIPRKCVNCSEKCVKHAYHIMCSSCAKSKSVCAKCCKTKEVTETLITEDKQDDDIQTILKALPERKRRTLLRYISKNQDEINKLKSETSSNDIAAKLEELKISLLNKKDDDLDELSSEEDFDSEIE